MERRSRQITRSADTISGMALTPDGKSVLFVTNGVEGGRPVNSIWTATLDGEKVTRVTQSSSPADDAGGPPTRGRGGFGGGFSSLQFAKDGRTLYYRQGRGIYAHSMGGGGSTGGDGAAPAATGRPGGRRAPAEAAGNAEAAAGGARRVAFTLKVEIDHAARRKQVFGESWRVMKNRFYDPKMNGVNWDEMKSAYEPLLPYVADQADLYDVVNMMIGEINASHTGISGGGGRGRGRAADSEGDSTVPGARS